MDIKCSILWSFLLLEVLVRCQYNPPSIPQGFPTYFSLPENTTLETEIFTLKAQDKDPGDVLNFKTSTPDTADLTKLGSTVFNGSLGLWTCKVFLNSVLDVDNSPSTRTLYFSLTDGQSVIQIRILMIITDVNDNPPRFVNLPYRTSIREDWPVQTSVFQVTATDPDTNLGSSIVYSIKSLTVDGNQTFSVQPSSGVLQLVELLDYEKQTFYHYNVSAKDQGNPPCPSNICQCKGLPEMCDPGPVDLFITIIDVEDTPPVFEKLPYFATVPENVTVGYSILQVTASDGDRGVSKPNDVVYSFSSGDFSSFVIDATDGTIRVGTVLDADSDSMRDQGGLSIFTVTATEIAPIGSTPEPNPNNQSSTQVSITVTDVNDNPPEFNSNSFQAYVLENTPAGVPIATDIVIEVYDKDQGSNSRFWIYLEKNGMPYYDFDTLPKQYSVIQGRSTVTIRVANISVLDYETTQNISFKIIAQENNTNPNITASSEATVFLKIEDTNDNNPYFPSQQTVFNVSENAPVGHVITTVVAYDNDSGDFGQLTFSLEAAGQDGEFNINDQGEIQVASPLDRESRSLLSIIVVATDSPLSQADLRRRSTLRIQIQVSDVNDHAPVWTQFIPYITILESTAIGTKITDLKAIDLDEGLNAQITYSIAPGTNGSQLFNVTTTDSGLAEINVQQSLIDHFGLCLLQVVATDAGTPPQSTALNVAIFVIDENQNKPIFIQPNQTQYETSGQVPEIEVEEEQPLGSNLYTLIAKDNDQGQNGLVDYYLNPTTNKDYEYFTVTRIDGTLLSAARLDRETKEIYEIQVKAEDRGQPASLFTVLTMRIRLKDIDDNEPSYKNVPVPQVLHVIEEKSNVYIGQISPAVDADIYPNNQSCYYLYGESNLMGFLLDKWTRNLSLVQKVDRETTDSLNIVIKASEICTLSNDFYILSYKNTTVSLNAIIQNVPQDYNVSDDSLLWVQILVDDINDSPPQFLYHELLASALYDVEIGTEITSLASSVQDKDTPPNRKNMFKSLSITSELEVGENLDTTKVPFLVSASGIVSTNIRFPPDLLGHFLLRVMVFDSDGLNDTANIKVFLVSNLQRIRLIFNKPQNQVEELKNSFLMQLSDILKIDLLIDKIQSHINPDGTRDPKRTDAYMHGRYQNNGTVVPASELWQMLDFSQAARALLYSFGVTEALPVSEEKNDDSLDELKVITAIVISILAVVAIVLLLILIYIIRLYRRRLRAATTMAYTTPREKDMFEHPGTNKYFAAENPLFGKEIKHITVDDDKTSINSLDVNAVDKMPPPAHSSDLNEEQEMVMQIADFPTDNSSKSNHLNQVLQAYNNAAFEKDGNDEDTFDSSIRGNSVHSVHSDGTFIPGIGSDIMEGVTRFPDDAMTVDSGLSHGNSKIHLRQTDI